MIHLLNNPHNWIILGLLLILAETFVIPGIGFLFAGLASFVTGSLLILGVIDNNFYSQLACFLTSSVISGIILYLPMKKLNKGHNKINNIVGEKALVQSEKLTPNELGVVRWSGTVFNAKLIEGLDFKNKNDQVEIIEIKGNILIVK